ncbi:LysM peptidoglycan-binding domain-containing protein [Anaeromicrobium sediminis]|nr:LysM peptidoglycan-binding domain-containing protein [Anaeromicrobium sediminis]
MFIGHKLEGTEDGYNIILQLDPNKSLVEFAKEFEHGDNEKDESLYDRIHKYVKKNFSNLKVANVKLVVGSLLLVSIPFANVSAFANSPVLEQSISKEQIINVKLDNEIQHYSQNPFVINGTAYVPLGEITKSVGGTTWSNVESKTIGVNKGDVKLAFVMGSSTARLNGKSIPMPEHYSINDSTMVPVKFIGEILGLNVGWDGESKTVILTTGGHIATETYTVQSGDSLWKIANKFNTSIDMIRSTNNLTSDVLQVGQKLALPKKPDSNPERDDEGNTGNMKTYTVQAGDSLWKIANKFNTSIDMIKITNNLTSDFLQVGQKLSIPNPTITETNPTTDNVATYIVQPGDTVNSIAKKVGTSPENILKYNYMDSDELLSAGETISVSAYAPRNYTITPGQEAAPLRKGKIVDWFREGQYLIKRNDVFTITDVDTGLQFKVKMMGGYNHSDIEPLTAADTQVMKQLFGTWTWAPRSVVIFHDGINIAASLAGMPHAQDTVANNNVTGHFDLYLSNSLSHNTGMPSESHEKMVQKAAK